MLRANTAHAQAVIELVVVEPQGLSAAPYLPGAGVPGNEIMVPAAL